MSTSERSLEQQLTQYMEAGHFPILYINSCEEERSDEAIRRVAINLEYKHITEWNGAGVVEYEICTQETTCGSCNHFESVLQAFLDNRVFKGATGMVQDNDSSDDKSPSRRILVLKEPQAYWGNPTCVALLREIARRINTDAMEECTVVIVSSVYSLPKELEHYTTILEEKPLSDDHIFSIVQETAHAWDATLDQAVLDEMATAFRGLSASEIQNILRLAYHQYEGVLDRKAMAMIQEQKRQTIKKSGILEMVEVNTKMDDIGGLGNLKAWLKRKASVFKSMREARAFGVDMPKGVLIAGVPGCGKSLSAKATAALLQVPLLRLDMGRLLGKYVGESEANMRQAISLAEAISPCVLWIDELEKAFAGVGGEGGGAEVTTRLLGSFLTWLQEKEDPVFVVATANDILKLPSELLRKGRFDEIFYVTLPNEKEREAILKIHIRKRRPQDLDKIDFVALAKEKGDYSGADLEGVVKDAIEASFAGRRECVSTEDILKVIQETPSLSKAMKDTLKEMEKKYKDRNYKSAS